jgi:AraC family transcriptional regulator
MPAPEMLTRGAKTGGELTYVEYQIECSSVSAPWRDLMRLERGRKLAAEGEFTLLWATVSIIRADSGILEQRVNREPLEVLSLATGCVLTYPERAAIHARMAQPADATCIQLAPGVLAGVAQELGRRPDLAATCRPHDEQAERIAALMEAELRAGCPNGRPYGQDLAQALAAYLLQNYSAARGPARGSARAGRQKISAALQYIQSNAQDLSIDKLASVSHLSPYHFSRLFKQSTGLTPHQYVLHWRIEEAKRLLTRTGLDLAEIAQRLGFHDQSHFTERFRKITGATPKRWRDKS